MSSVIKKTELSEYVFSVGKYMSNLKVEFNFTILCEDQKNILNDQNKWNINFMFFSKKKWYVISLNLSTRYIVQQSNFMIKIYSIFEWDTFSIVSNLLFQSNQ